MSAHTPGPWHIERGTSVYVRADDAHHVGPICSIRSRLDYPGMDPIVAETLDANARLIAAAPDLLAALRSLVMEHGGTLGCQRGDERAVAVRAAIAKATGESHD